MILKQLDELVTSLSPEDRNATLSTLRRIFDNIIQHPNDDKYHQIKLTDETFSSKVWQYSAGEELMKMSGWIVEDDHVRLRDDSCVQIVSHLLKSFMSSSATGPGVVPIPDNEFQILIRAFYYGDIVCIKKLLKVFHISPNGRVYSESEISVMNLLCTATIIQQIDIIELLVKDYHMDPYYEPYIMYMFFHAPQSFIIAILKYCYFYIDFKTTEGFSLLHIAIAANCFDIIHYLLEECSDIDVNVTDDYMHTSLHLAYLYGHTQIAQHLIQQGADVNAVDDDSCTPYDYINGDPKWIEGSEYLQNHRKIHHVPFSDEHCYFIKLINLEEEAVILTMEQFPSLKGGRLTQCHHNIDHVSALKAFTEYIQQNAHAYSD